MLPTIELPRIDTGLFSFGNVAVASYSFDIPTPHDKQAAFLSSDAKRKVVVSGRRGGKTTGFAIAASQGLKSGKRVLYAGPTSDQTDKFWYACRWYCRHDIEAGHLLKSETKRVIEPMGVDDNGPRIRAKTAWDADSLRGDWGDLLLLDEYSLMTPDVDTVVLPMLLDTDGDIIYGGTPQRRNHFFRKYVKAVSDVTGRWGYWHFTSYDNPHLSKAALAEIEADLTVEMHKQEILAEFLENEGAVFRNIAACMNAPAAKPEDHKGHHVVLGADWAKQSDFSAFSCGCVDCHVELAIDRQNKIDYHFQWKRLEVMCQKWHVTQILVEQNSVGEAGLEALQRAGLPVSGFQTTATSKTPLIENLALCLEREEWQFQADDIWTGELEAYERKVSKTTGRSQYSAPEGLNDDTVIARALMVRAANRPRAADLVDFA